MVARLLICDDHRLLLDALSMALTQSGYTVVATALDPDEAVAAARTHQPDLCLLDVNFRHANGLSAIARIHEVSADTKVVMFSASIDRPVVVEAIARGAQGYVGKEKPVGRSSRRWRWHIGGSWPWIPAYSRNPLTSRHPGPSGGPSGTSGGPSGSPRSSGGPSGSSLLSETTRPVQRQGISYFG